MIDYTTQRMPHAEIPGCALVQDLLPLYLDSEVTPESHVLIRDHLARCERCSGFLAGAQSVRAQMLKEQQAMRSAQAQGPSVAQVQQPVKNSFGRIVWLGLLTLGWLVGLFGLSIGSLSGVAVGFIIGITSLVFSVVSLAATTSKHGVIWNSLAILTGLLGFAFFVAPIFEPWLFERVQPLPFLVGLILLAVAAWGLLSRPAATQAQPSQPPQPQQPAGGRGLSGAISTAAWSLLAASGLVFLALLGLWLVAADPRAPGLQFFGVLLTLAGSVGLLELNQRRGWFAEWAVPKTKRRLQSVLLLGGGAIWSLLVLQGWGIGSVAFLLALGIGAGLVFAGLWWFQRNR